MNKLILRCNKIIFLGSLFLTLFSCSALKISSFHTIVSNYKITKVEKTDKEIPQLICFIYDIQGKSFIYGAIIEIDELKLDMFTEKDGSCKLEIPTGRYKIKAMSIGNTTIQTKYINFESYTSTEIKFELGTTIEW